MARVRFPSQYRKCSGERYNYFVILGQASKVLTVVLRIPAGIMEKDQHLFQET